MRGRKKRPSLSWQGEIDWKAASLMERAAYIRSGFVAGVTCAAIGAAAGVSRSAVTGAARRAGLTVSNAAVWTPERGAAIVAARPKPAPYDRPKPPPPTKRETAAKRRANMGNLAKDEATRQAVDKLNAAPFHDYEIALEMGVSHSTLTKWRRGLTRGTPFLLGLVDEAIRRLSN